MKKDSKNKEVKKLFQGRIIIVVVDDEDMEIEDN